MINIGYIQEKLVGLVGYKQPFNPEYAIVDADNQISESGYYITDNSYAKIEYIKDNQDYLNISDSDFNVLLKSIKTSSIASVVNQVFQEPDFIDRDLMFKSPFEKTEVTTLPLGFVGYKICFANDVNKTFSINRVLLNFDNVTDVELILWNTGKKEPIFSKIINVVSDTQEEFLNWEISSLNNIYKGDYYIGYITNNLTASPYKRDDSSDYTDFLDLSIERVFVANHNSNNLFNLDLPQGFSDDIGLNFDISIYYDYTGLIVNNKRLFSRAIHLQCIINCIQLYMSSLRNNSNNIEANILYEKMMIDLEGVATNRSINVKGLKNKLVTEITMIRQEIKKLTGNFVKKGVFITTLR